MEDKIEIITSKKIANKLRKELLNNKDVTVEDINIVEQQRESLFKVKIKARLWVWRSNFSQTIQTIKQLIKYRRIEPMLGGGGGFDFETLYGFVVYLFTVIIVPGLRWDLIKLIIKKSYKLLRKEKGYIVIASTVRGPGDTLIRMKIPTNLSDEELDECLRSGEEMYKHIDEIRGYFGYYKIFIIHKGNYRWKLKFKSKIF